MVIRYRGTSPKLGSSQGECPYPCAQVSFGGGNEEKGKEAMKDQAPEGGQSMLIEGEEEEDILQPYYSHLTPIEIEAFRAFEAVRVQNKFLIRENILLEEHINTLRRVIRKLEYLLSLKCDTSSPPPSSSPPPKET